VTVKVLVTGASGFIGSHLAELLVREGYGVRAFVRDTSASKRGNLELLPMQVQDSIEYVAGDLRDSEAINEAVQSCETVFHLGAMISVPNSVQHPEETFDVNVRGAMGLLQAARHHNVKRVVIASSSAVYGSALYVPIDENHPLQAQSPYAASKISAEALSLSFYHSYNTPVVIVRPFNAYGPRQSTRAVIPSIISQALSKSTIALGSVDTVRDFTYAADTARGLLLAATSEAAVGQTINLGSGQSVTILDIAQKIVAQIDRKVVIEANNSQRVRNNNSESLRLEADTTKAATLLSWRAETPLEVGLKQTIDWMRDHSQQFDPDNFTV
jgi:nucleoside-diphosphate-sugar epimerase